ncbi:WcaI family glycosyltransferase [Mucilaginibacter polytrichastri]|uniref:WcaI family glycosyltransferase n=1 Tax=Mucilaginibacter polytrichastri TaxID=1302689 RepID=UPI0008E5C98D|nr:WcaI family glycosyltransferase [Mucilaginibacter polytrichastri]SFS43650.1 colanic acid biosynthesis glycosyl transferase WcaI [Mucilaginibacter polytrichastri]
MDIKKVLLIGHNFSPEPTGIGKYNGEMIAWLAANGFDCTVVTTFPYYPQWKVQAPYQNKWWWYKKEVMESPGKNPVTVYRCPSYTPADPTGKKRMIQDMSFWSSKIWQVFKLILFKKRFDLIITVAPPFHLAYLGLMLRKLTGGRLVYHIQDLQIEAAQDLNILSNQTMFNRLYKMEKNILESADYVSSISDGMIKKIEEKVDKKVLFFPNWADTSYFLPLDNRQLLKTEWGFSANDVVYLYSGAIGEKQGLENIIFAAEQVQHDKNIKFVICGSGPYKEKLAEFAQARSLTNVSFLPVQEKDAFNKFLNMADFHLVLQKSNAGDLVMPSKLTTILAVGGVCIVTAAKDTSLYNVIEKYNVGYIIPPEDYEALAQKVLEVKADLNVEFKRANSRKYAIQYLNIDQIMQSFINEVSAD